MVVARLGLRATRVLRAPAIQVTNEAGGAAAPKQSWASTKRAPLDPSTFPQRTKPRWQNAPGQEAFVPPPRFPMLAAAQKYLHYAGVFALISLTVYTSYWTYASFTAVKARRLAWEKANPEEHQRLVREAAAKKAAAAIKGATKYGVIDGAQEAATTPK